MKSFFIDTSEKLVLGILDDKFQWIDYINTNEKKGSGIIHGILFELLKSNNLKIDDIDNIFLMAGPGSYTGMRLGEGLAQVLEVFNINIYSTYHFDIPKILNINDGLWCSGAFKGEMFVYSWSGEKENYFLIKEDIFKIEFSEALSNNTKVFTNVYTENELFKECEETSKLIKENSELIFNNLYNNKIRKDLYYYRPLELEFKQTAI
jgi:tRNA threonylcarbamoyladenosine biosynthesis protein TsaB